MATFLGGLARSEAQNPGGHDVEERVRREHDEGADDQLTPAVLEHLGERRLDLLALGDGLGEDRRLFELEPHVQPDDHHDRAEQERNAPAPFEEGARQVGVAVVVAERQRDDQEQAVGADEADGCAELRPHRRPGALAGFGRLGGEQRRTRPLPTETQALAEAHERQQRRCDEPGLVIGRQQADEEGRDAHRQERADERDLAADAVAEVPEDDGSDRAGDESDTEGREGGEQRGRAVALREEQVREDRDGGCRIDVEIVELDGRADHAGDDDAPARNACDERGTPVLDSDRCAH